MVFHAKGHNLTRQLTMEYDKALAKFNVLALPTVPMLAPRIPDKTDSLEVSVSCRVRWSSTVVPCVARIAIHSGS